MPLVGDWTTPPDRSYAAVYDKNSEKASPGYYSVYFPTSRSRPSWLRRKTPAFIVLHFQNRTAVSCSWIWARGTTAFMWMATGRSGAR